MSNIMPGQPGDTNPTAPVEPTEREQLMFMLVHGGAASNSIAKWRVDRFASETRAEVLSEVADMLMKADESAAALLVDRLRGGDPR